MRKPVAIIHLDTLKVDYDPSFKFRCLENCAKCCAELDIPLRDGDIIRIEDFGFSAWEFVDYNKMFYRGDKFIGYALKKRPFDGLCPFLDENSRCKIYPGRPLACKLYPFMLVKQEDTIEVYVKDPSCPGIGDRHGKPVNFEFVMEYFGEVIEEYRKKLNYTRVPGAAGTP